MPIPPEDRTLIFGADIDLTQFNGKLTQMAQGITGFGINYTAQLEKLTQQQVAAGRKLEQSQQSLKSVSDDVLRKQQEAANAAGKNDAIYKQNQKSLQDSINLQKQLTEEVARTQSEYDALGVKIGETNKIIAQQKTAGLPPTNIPELPFPSTVAPPGEIPFPRTIQPVTAALPGVDAGLPALLSQVEGHFKDIEKAVEQAKIQMQGLNKESQEFKDLQAFATAGEEAINKYKTAVELASQTTEQLDERITNAKTTIQTIRTTEVSELPVVIAKSRQEMEQLSDSVEIADQKLRKLNPNDVGFAPLAKTVAEGRKTLTEYATAVQQTNIQQTTFRTQMIAGQQALAKMVEEGKEGTKEFQDMQIHVAKLTQEYRIQHEQLRVLASETRGLDFGKAAIGGAIQGFEAYTAISILAGGESEKLQKKTMALFAAMQLMTAVEGLANSIRKGSILNTNVMTVAQNIYTAAVVGTTGALRAFRIALLATGVGAALVVLGFLIKKYIDFREELKKTREEQSHLNDAFKSTEYKTAIENVDRLKNEIRLAKEGFISKKETLDDYNETIGKTTGQVKSLDAAEQALEKNADAYIKFTLLKAAANIALGKAAQAAVDAAEEDQKRLTEFSKNFPAKPPAPTPEKLPPTQTVGFSVQDVGDQAQKTRDAQQAEAVKDMEADKQRGQKKVQNFESIAKGFFDQAAQITSQYHFDFYQKLTQPKDQKEPENLFEKEKADLEAKLAQTRKDEIQTVTRINNEFAAKLVVEQQRIAKEIEDKRLTPEQGKIIFKLTVELNRKEADEAIAEFTKKFKDEQDKLEEQIRVASVKTQTEQINLIQDEFTRRGKLIEVQQKEEIHQEQLATDAKLKTLIELHKSETISEEQYEKDRDAIINNGELQINNTIRKYNQEREQLSIDTFKSILAQTEGVFHDATASIEHAVTEEIVKQSKLFQSGEISYKQFSDSIEKTQRESDKTIRDASIRSTEEELLRVKLKLDTTRDTTSKGYKELLAIRKKLEEDLDKQRKEGAISDAKIAEDIKDARIAAVQAWATAVGDIISGVTNAFAEANRIEEQMLDRSIALQEKRVEEARRIADKGNAAYLKDEQDRLKKLQVEREAAAKKELGINAVVQESQAIVAVISAIAQGAKVGGALGAAIDAAAIIALIASTYALVKSLSPPPPTFEKGTTFVQRGTHPQGRDTIPAMLDEGEAVLPRDRNRDYHPAVEAIYERAVPAEVLNKFVTIYKKEKGITSEKSTTTEKSADKNVSNEVLSSHDRERETKSDRERTEKSQQSDSSDYGYETERVFDRLIQSSEREATYRESDKKTDSQTEKITSSDVMKQIVQMSKTGEISSTEIMDMFTTLHKEGVMPHAEVTDRLLTLQNAGIVPATTVINRLLTHNGIKDMPQVINRILTSNPIELPVLRHDKLQNANETRIEASGKLGPLLEEQNRLLREDIDLHRQTQHVLKHMGVDFKFDKNGVSVMLMKAIEQKKIDLKT